MILEGDCRETLKTLAAESVSSIVTDPPYEIGFMGKGWDGSGVANDPELWAECFRVLKPGGHVLAFGAARTYHRMACAIEDAGFEIRDSIHWVYGSGFPKSHNVSKGIDRRGGHPQLARQIGEALKAARISRKMTMKQADEMFCNGSSNWSWFEGRPIGQRAPTPTTFGTIVEAWPEMSKLANLVAEADREVTGHHQAGNPIGVYEEKVGNGTGRTAKERRDNPATDDARKWEGWGTALKPAHEPIVMARKPFAGTVAQNVLEHGTGAINIDGARIGQTSEDAAKTANNWKPQGYEKGINVYNLGTQIIATEQNASGRWPANVILTHSAECKQIGVVEDKTAAGERTANFGTQETVSGGNGSGGFVGQKFASAVWKCMPDCPAREIDQQAETASRYYAQPEWQPGDYLASVYTPKAGKRERNAGLDGMPEINRYKPGGVGGTGGCRSVEAAVNAQPVANHHPTVKPVALMRYLIRLVTPLGGTVLDPFLGSGTTAVAAILERFEWIGCEITAEYLPIIAARCQWARENIEIPEPTLFDGDTA